MLREQTDIDDREVVCHWWRGEVKISANVPKRRQASVPGAAHTIDFVMTKIRL